MKIDLYPQQAKAFTSKKRIILFVGGLQIGKTTVGSAALGRWAFQQPRHLNYIIAAPNYKMLSQATLPKFLKFFGDKGTYHGSKQEFHFYHGPIVYIRTATHPESVEGITDVGGIWGDEAGLFSKYFFENLMGRAAFKQAQMILTSTPYALNWLYELWKDKQSNTRDDIEFIGLKSVDSPYFPKEEYDRQKKLLDPRRFAMKYEGEFGKMVGLVYEDVPSIRSFQLPTGTKYYAGIDWGFHDPFVIHTRAVTPEGIHYQCDEFGKSGMMLSDMIQAIIQRHRIYNYQLTFCDPSRPEYIKEFNAHGIKAVAADNTINLGIDRHKELIRTNRFFIFQDRCSMTLDEYSTYHYPEPKELGIDDNAKEIVPVDANNHFMDASRYVSMGLHHLVKNPNHFVDKINNNRKPNYEKVR